VRVFSYIVSKDYGYAPNPFHGVCTLACCKPEVRRSAQPGDIVLGLTSKDRGNRLVYGMLVAERFSFEQYWHDPRFRVKRPDMASARGVDRRGDNHYEPISDGVFRQHPSRHSHPDGSEKPESMRVDLGHDRRNPVLVSTRFCYFGTEAILLPAELSFLIVGRGHRCIFTEDQVRLATEAFTKLPQGIQAPPHRWSVGDESWRPNVSDMASPAPATSPRKRRSERGTGHCS
jgi:hypothetical protein